MYALDLGINGKNDKYTHFIVEKKRNGNKFYLLFFFLGFNPYIKVIAYGP